MNLKVIILFISIIVLTESVSEPKFAPYIHVPRKEDFKLVDRYQKYGLKAVTLAFALGGSSCAPTWGGVLPIDEKYVIDEIKAFKAVGGDIIIATGGAEGPYLEQSCTSAQTLADAYKKVLNVTGSTHIDFDVEASVGFDTVMSALAQLQKQNSQITVSFTLMVQGDDYGLTDSAGVGVIKNAVSHGVRVDIVNPMAMDFGSSKAWGDAVISASESTVKQMKGIWPQKSDQELYGMLGVTPMIGVNDNRKVFTTANAKQLVDWANSKGVAHLAFWSLGRDNGGCSDGRVSPSCSGIAQADHEFTKIFMGFKGRGETPTTASTGTTKQSSTAGTTKRVSTSSTATTKSQPTTPKVMDCSKADVYYPHETDCQQYYWCYGGAPHLQKCGDGTIFDTHLNVCNFPRDANRPECNK